MLHKNLGGLKIHKPLAKICLQKLQQAASALIDQRKEVEEVEVVFIW